MFYTNFSKRDPFEKIFLLMTIAGYFIKFPNPNENSKSRCSKILKIYTFVVIMVKSLCFLLSVVTLYQLIISWSILLTVYALAIGGFSMSCFLHLRRKDIVRMAHRLCVLYRSLKPDGDMGNKHLDWIMLVYAMIVAFFCVVFSVFTFHYSWNEYRSRLNIPPFLKHHLGDCTWLAGLSIILTHSTSLSACGMALILCDATFRVTSEIIKAYAENLTRSLSFRSMSAEMSTLRSIAARVGEADRALNVFTLLLYGIFFVVLFLMISAGLSNEERIINKMMVSAGVCVFVAVVSFFSMVTLSGARVQEEGERLKKIVLECSDGMAEVECNKALILLENVKELKLVVTGGAMFVIERKLFLTLGGTMVTYGVILFQMNQV